MRIRQATIEDATTITEFNALIALETEALILDRTVLSRGVAAILRNPSKGKYFLAEIDGHVAGQTMITYEWSDWRNGYFWWIQSVYVKQEFRRQGIFGALYRYVRDLADSSANVCGLRLYVETSNDRAKRVYEHFGMHKSNYEMYEAVFPKGAETGHEDAP